MGVDASDAMVAELRRKPGGARYPGCQGDFADFLLDTRYDVVYVVFNTFFDLTSQDAQVRCFASAARHLNAGGVFVIEAFVPDHSRLARDNNVHWDVYGDVVRVDVRSPTPASSGWMLVTSWLVRLASRCSPYTSATRGRRNWI